MHIHKIHSACEHKKVKYCKICDVIYCEDCNIEWNRKDLPLYTYPNPEDTFYLDIQDTKIISKHIYHKGDSNYAVWQG